ncbi:MAG: DnaJ domain-containing protein [Nitrososphaeraceae archaeon]
MDVKGYYAIMGVSEQANYREVRAAYRRLAKKYHPDVNGSLYAEETIKTINAAFEVLSDKEKRSEYDRLVFDNDYTLQQQQQQQRGHQKENENDVINTDAQSSNKSENKDNRDRRSTYRNFYSDLINNSNHAKADNSYYRSVKQDTSQPSAVTTDPLDTKSRFHIIVEPSLCMAFGSCETLAPKVFVVEKNKIFNPKAKVVSETAEDFDAILAAAQTCPTKAIFIIDRNTGECIYP